MKNSNITLVTKYLCSECGFIEDGLDYLKDIEKVKKYYRKQK